MSEIDLFGMPISTFAPHLVKKDGDVFGGSITYLSKDASSLERPVPGTQMVLIHDAHAPDTIIGVRIENTDTLVAYDE